MKISRLIWLFIFVIIVLNTMIWPMLSEGMFLDGMIYGTISRNIDLSSLWDLKVMSYNNTRFFDHPPFLFWMQGLLFKIIGDHFWTEHLYSIFMFFGFFFLFFRCLHKIENEKGLNEQLFLGIILLCSPIFLWSFANNMLENTTLVLTFGASYFILSSLQTNNRLFLKSIISVVLLTMAFLTKGPVCLFPMTIPFFYFIIYPDKQKRSITIFGILMAGLILFALIFYMNEASNHFLAQYLDQQIVAAIKGERAEIAASRFRIIKCLLNNTLLILILSLIGLYVRNRLSTTLHKKSILYLLIALSGSIPLLLTTKQACIYIMPVIPYFILAARTPLLRIFDILEKYRTKKIFIVFILLTGLIATIYFSRDRRRHGHFYRDSKIIVEHVPRNESIHLYNLCFNYELKAYFSRYNIANGTCDKMKGYLISDRILDECEKIAELSVGTLYKCNL